MNTYRTNAVVAGALYITGTVAGIMSLVLSQPLHDPGGPLAGAAANATQVTVAALCALLMALSLAMVPVVLYPALRRHSEVLALGYVVFRGALETVAVLVSVIAWVLSVELGRLSVLAGAAGSTGYEATGTLLLAAGDLGRLTSIVFCMGAAMFYALLYQSRLVPRWIPVWGLAALVPYLAADILGLFALLDPQSSTAVVLHLPLALQEMVLAVWLIAKGFNSVAIARGTAQPATDRLLSAA